MKKTVLLIICVIFSNPSLAGSNGSTSLAALHSQISYNDLKNYSLEFNCGMVDRWWELADHFALDFLNSGDKNYEKNKSEILKTEFDNIELQAYDSGSLQISMRFSRPVIEPKRTVFSSESLTIYFLPLREDNSVIYVSYSRHWYELPNAEGLLEVPGTFRIFKKASSGSDYKLVATFESSNFRRRIIARGTFKYHTGEIVPYCEWDAQLKHDSIKLDPQSEEINFETLYILGFSGAPYMRLVYVKWTLKKNGKLQASQYKYSTNFEPNPEAEMKEKENVWIPIEE